MTNHRRVGSRAPLNGLALAVLALLLLPGLVLGAEWTRFERVSSNGGTRLDSLHQVAASGSYMHVVHPRIGPKKTDDRLIYQRSSNDGASWSSDRTLFKANRTHRKVVPNLAIDARGAIVAVAFRVGGPKGHTLFVRVSRDGGRVWGPKTALFSTSKADGIGVPAVAVGDGFISVAWTNRASGAITIRTSRNAGTSFKSAQTLGATRMSIDCNDKVTDGLVGIAASHRTVHVAWSSAGKRQCFADEIKVRTSADRGSSWGAASVVTKRDSFGWPELDARGGTVIATVQSVDGEIVVARSGNGGRKWQRMLFTPSPGHIFSAADVTLLPKRKVMLAYVKERLKGGRLYSTRIVTRRSPDDGVSWNRVRPVTTTARRLRMAANVVNIKGRVTIVVQSGALDGSPRHIYATRLR